MRESKARSLMKAISWRVFGSLLTGVISFLLTHQLTFALSIGALEFFSKIIFFYFHERLWETIPFGARKSTTADIPDGA